MSREKELAKNTAILTFGKICTQFVSFLLLPLYTALLEPAEFGIVDLFNTYILLLVPIFNWQFENGLFRFMLDCRGNHKQQTKLFSNVFAANIFQSILYLVFYLVAQNFISSEYKIFLAIDVVLNIFQNTLLQFPRGLGDNKTYAMGSFLSATIVVAMNAVFIAGFKMGVLGMFLAVVVAKCVTVMYLATAGKIWKYIDFRMVDKDELIKISKYSFPLVPNQLAWWTIGASDRTILSKAVSISANGIYSVANKFSSIYVTFYNIFNMSWTETVSLHIDDEDRDEFLTETINSMFNLFATFCFGIIACLPFVFPILINEQYQEAYYQVPILMIAVLFQIVVGLYSVIYVAKKRSSEIAKTSTFAAIINVTVNLLLVNRLQIYAESISTLTAYAAMAFYRYFHVKKYVNIVLRKKSIVLVGIVACITIIPYYLQNTVLQVIALVFVIIYAYMINKSFIHSMFQMMFDIIKKMRGKLKY